MRKIKISSGGNGANTKIIDADSGESLDGVVGVIWCCRVGELARVNIEFTNVSVEVVGEEVT